VIQVNAPVMIGPQVAAEQEHGGQQKGHRTAARSLSMHCSLHIGPP
jgi:hypothetical protein